MENQLMTKEMTYTVGSEEIKLTGNTVKNYLVKGNGKVSDQEIVMFMNLCKYQKLNPFLNEAYLVKFGEQSAQLITAKGAYMKKAENHPQYDGLRAGVIIQRKDETLEVEGSFTLKGDILLGGWAEVWRKDKKFPFKEKVSLDEYNKSQSTWKSMPRTMIRKVAIVQAMREAFPDELNGMYVEEETQGIEQNVDSEVKEEIKGNANKEVIDIQPEEMQEVKDKPQEQKTQPDKKAEQTKLNEPGF